MSVELFLISSMDVIRLAHSAFIGIGSVVYLYKVPFF